MIFDGLQLDLTAMFWKTIFGTNKFDNLHTYLNDETFLKSKIHIDKYFEKEGLFKKQNELEHNYTWKISNCNVTLGQGDRLGKYYYLEIKYKNFGFSGNNF